MNEREARKFIQNLPTDKPTSGANMLFWGTIFWDADFITLSPSEECTIGSPLSVDLSFNIEAGPGDTIKIYAQCKNTDEGLLPTVEEFYFEAAYLKDGHRNPIRSSETFKTQGDWYTFTMTMPENADTDTVCLSCVLSCYYPDLEIAIDQHYEIGTHA